VGLYSCKDLHEIVIVWDICGDNLPQMASGWIICTRLLASNFVLGLSA